MATPKVPDGWELETAAPALPAGWEFDTSTPAIPPGSPLAKALATQKGDVVTVETPTGPAQFDRQGNRVASPEEMAAQMDAGGAGLKQRMLEGALSVASGGGPLVDEAQGVKSALKRSMATLAGKDAVDPLTAYRQGRDDARRLVKSATANASPTVSVMGVDVPVLPVLGMVASSGPSAAGVVPRLLASGFGAGLNAFGASEGNSPAEVATDTAAGGALGVGGAAVGEALGAVSRPLAKALRRESGLAADVVKEAEKKAADKAVRSAVGTVGGHTAGVANTLGRLEEIARNPLGLYSADEVAAAVARLKEPDMVALRQQMTQNLMAKAGNQGPALERAREEMLAAIEASAPEAVAAKAAEKLDPSKQGKDFAGSLWRSLGQRALISGGVGALGAGAAALTGNDPKMGGLTGLAGGAFLSQPGVLAFLRNQAGNPARQALINSMAANAAETAGRTVGDAGRLVGTGAARGKTELTNEERLRIQAFLSALRDAPTP